MAETQNMMYDAEHKDFQRAGAFLNPEDYFESESLLSALETCVEGPKLNLSLNSPEVNEKVEDKMPETLMDKAPPLPSLLLPEDKSQRRFRLGSGSTSDRIARHGRSISDTLRRSTSRVGKSKGPNEQLPARKVSGSLTTQGETTHPARQEGPLVQLEQRKIAVCGNASGKTCLTVRASPSF